MHKKQRDKQSTHQAKTSTSSKQQERKNTHSHLTVGFENVDIWPLESLQKHLPNLSYEINNKH